MTQAKKAKRKLSDISFEKDGAHVALVSKKQGGPANKKDFALVIKATDFSEEVIEKMQQVKVTMELPDFLQRFFNLWEGDAKVLATMMGYVEQEDPNEDQMEAEEEFQSWIEERMQAFEIVKSAYEADDIDLVLSELDENQYLALLQDQQMLEKAIKKAERTLVQKAYTPKTGDMVSWSASGGTATGKVKRVVREGSVDIPGSSFKLNAEEDNPAVLIQLYRDGEPTDTVVGHKANTLKKISKSSSLQESTEVAKSTEEDTSIAGEVKEKEVSTSVVNDNLEKSMTSEIKTVEQEVTVEMVEKSALDSIQKAFNEQKEQLEKALLSIAQFEAEKKAAIAKARLEQVKTAVKDEAKAEILFKAVSLVESDDEFNAVVKALADMTAAVEKSDLFVEKGASVESDAPAVKESAVAKLLKAKQVK